jgi:UDP-3-O-[3-hydroxymyristoyl] glucosamine N-acyltransferase
MRKTLKEIARIIDGEVVGDENTVITGISGIREAEAGDLTFLSNPKYAPLLDSTRASAVIAARDVGATAKPLIRTDNPSLAFAKVISAFSPAQTSRPKGIHKTAIVSKKAKLAKGVAVGAYCVIEDGASVGAGTIMYPGCFIGEGVSIGREGLIYPNVTLRERVVIGERVIIHSGTVIGSDGFGFVNVDGKHIKIPQVGTVEICDDVEIGSCVTIDRARFDKTVIGRGTKIDNLVQIAHNVVVGENSLIISQAGISGSTVIGNNVIIAGQAGLVGHITIGDGAVLAAQAGITKSVPPNTMVSGYPARPHEKAKVINACVQNLPKLYEELKELKKKIEELENKGNG